MNDNKDKLTVKKIEEPKNLTEFLKGKDEILLMPEDDFREGHRVLKPEAYQLAKWVRQNRPEIKIGVLECEEKIDSNDMTNLTPILL